MSWGNFYNSKKVFLTGHTGFKGAWLSRFLKILGAEVGGFSLPPEPMSLFNVCGNQSIVDHNIGDVGDFSHLEQVLTDFDPDIVFHFAAQPLVRLSYAQPLRTFQTNVVGTANLLEASRKSSRKPLVAIITSDKCYDNQEKGIPFKESDPMGGKDPYSASKGAAELIVGAFAESFYTKNAQSLVTLRGGNVIGGGDWADDRIMTDIFNALVNGTQLSIRSPEAVRPWQHILDVLSGYLSAVFYLSTKSPGSFEKFNIGPTANNIKTVKELVETSYNLWGAEVQPFYVDQSNNMREASLLLLDVSKALNELEWKPKFDFKETVGATVDWYQAYSDGNDMRAFTDTQIERYVSGD